MTATVTILVGDEVADLKTFESKDRASLFADGFNHCARLTDSDASALLLEGKDAEDARRQFVRSRASKAEIADHVTTPDFK